MKTSVLLFAFAAFIVFSGVPLVSAASVQSTYEAVRMKQASTQEVARTQPSSAEVVRTEVVPPISIVAQETNFKSAPSEEKPIYVPGEGFFFTESAENLHGSGGPESVVKAPRLSKTGTPLFFTLGLALMGGSLWVLRRRSL